MHARKIREKIKEIRKGKEETQNINDKRVHEKQWMDFDRLLISFQA